MWEKRCAKVVIRRALPGDCGAIARVHVDAWRAAYAGIVPESYLAGLEYSRSTLQWDRILKAGATHVFVAEDAQEGVVGFVAAGPELEGDAEYDANVSAIYLLPEQQGRGAGRALMAAAVQALFTDGRRSLLVWVLRDNRACGFYERLGGRPVRAREQTIGGAQLALVGYGWPDLAALAEALGRPAAQ